MFILPYREHRLGLDIAGRYRYITFSRRTTSDERGEGADGNAGGGGMQYDRSRFGMTSNGKNRQPYPQLAVMHKHGYHLAAYTRMFPTLRVSRHFALLTVCCDGLF